MLYVSPALKFNSRQPSHLHGVEYQYPVVKTISHRRRNIRKFLYSSPYGRGEIRGGLFCSAIFRCKIICISPLRTTSCAERVYDIGESRSREVTAMIMRDNVSSWKINFATLSRTRACKCRRRRCRCRRHRGGGCCDFNTHDPR